MLMEAPRLHMAESFYDEPKTGSTSVTHGSNLHGQPKATHANSQENRDWTQVGRIDDVYSRRPAVHDVSVWSGVSVKYCDLI